MRLLLLLSLLCSASNAAALTVTDDTGTRIEFDAPPQRIVSLAPNLTELGYASGLGERMVAVSAYSNYPEQAERLPQIGDAFRLDWERLVALKPDLVLAWGSGLPQDHSAFEKLGFKLLVLEPHRLNDIPRTLRLLGRIANTEGVSERAALAFEKQRENLRKKYAGRPEVSAYFQISEAPLLTVSGGHIISDVLRLCGARNVFSDVPLLVPPVTEEALIHAQPQIMLGLAETPAQQEETRSWWRKLPLTAAQQDRMAFVHPDFISRPTPRILQGAEEVCEKIESARRTAPGGSGPAGL